MGVSVGNPVDSPDVDDFLDGYTRQMSDHGYRPQSAAPWHLEDVVSVVQHLSHVVRDQQGMTRVLAARDLFLLTVQWTCVSRGTTAVQWCINDITLRDGTNIQNIYYSSYLNACKHVCNLRVIKFSFKCMQRGILWWLSATQRHADKHVEHVWDPLCGHTWSQK